MKRHNPKKSQFLAVKPLVFALSAALSGAAFALPTLPNVVSGNVNMAQNGNQLIINNSNGSIINWGSFSIGADELVRFNQASSSSAVLNRVTGSDPSVLLGILQSNGKVFLVNPAGIFVGAGARIDVGAFVASTLNISDANFKANNLHFEGLGNTGQIKNEGIIKTPEGGQIYFIANQIENTGEINAAGGNVGLIAANEVKIGIEIGDTASPGVRVLASNAHNEVSNAGKISSDAGQIGLVGALIKNSGVVDASSATLEGGKIYFKASENVTQESSGQIKANGISGGKIAIDAGNTTLIEGEVNANAHANANANALNGNGGNIEITGDKVGILGSAEINANGENTGNGGTVLIGGDYQGGNAEVKNAQFTAFAPDTIVNANAGKNGNGGKVILWAEDATKAYGAINVRGGSVKGDGGFVEVSGKKHLDFQAKEIDRRATNGKAGTLLLDPTDIAIRATTGAANNWSGGMFNSEDADASSISWANIDTQLNLGNVIISTKSGGYATNGGSITIHEGATLTGANKLTLLAEGSILDGTNVGTLKTNGDILMMAGWDSAASSASAPVLKTGYNTNTSVATALDGSIKLYKISLESAKSIDLRARSVIRLQDISIKTTKGGNISLLSKFVQPTDTNSAIWAQANTKIEATNSQIGGSAGNVTLTSESGRIRLEAGSKFSSNGAAGDESTNAGSGGVIKLDSNVDVRFAGAVTLEANGGDVTGAKDGGNGGQVLINAGNNIVPNSSNITMSAKGGKGASGGNGGVIKTKSTEDSSFAILNLDASGGEGTQNNGGQGGSIAMTSDKKIVISGASTVQTNGGESGATSTGNGGAGGSITLNSTDDTNLGNVQFKSIGGSVTNNSALGGDGGTVNIDSKKNVVLSNSSVGVKTSGGGSSISSNVGTGGNAAIKSTEQLSLTNSTLLFDTGGQGVNGTASISSDAGVSEITNSHITSTAPLTVNTANNIELSGSSSIQSDKAVTLNMSGDASYLGLTGSSKIISGNQTIALNYSAPHADSLKIDGTSHTPASYSQGSSFVGGSSGFYSVAAAPITGNNFLTVGLIAPPTPLTPKTEIEKIKDAASAAADSGRNVQIAMLSSASSEGDADSSGNANAAQSDAAALEACD